MKTIIKTEAQQIATKGKLARGIISGRYPISRREKELTQLVFELTS